MYMFKSNINLKYINKAEASKIIGVSRVTLSNVLNRKCACRKVVAYCITKFINNNAEITDYFEEV